MMANKKRRKQDKVTLWNAALESYKQALDAAMLLGDGTGHTSEQVHFHQAKLLRVIGIVFADLAQGERAAECFEVAGRFFAVLGMDEARADVEYRRAAIAKSLQH
jgi:hypothetical protein